MTRQTRIPADHVGPYERWEMPDLTGVRRSISRRLQELEAQREAEASAEQEGNEDEQALVAMPSNEEIEALKAQAYQDGHQEGVSAGHAEGYEHGRAEGYASGEREGSEAGFQSGYEKGLELARNEIDQLSARFQSQLDQLLHPLAHVDDDAEQALLELAELIATGVLRRELTIDRSSLEHIVQEALKALPDTSRRLRIHVHPDDKVLVEAACEGRFDDYRVVDDPEVTPGGVHIETQYSLVDCTVERRYRALVEKLMGEQYPDHSPAVGPLPRRPESDSPLGPGHFSAEAALAELESLRAELAAALGDDASYTQPHTASQSNESSIGAASVDAVSDNEQSGDVSNEVALEDEPPSSLTSHQSSVGASSAVNASSLDDVTESGVEPSALQETDSSADVSVSDVVDGVAEQGSHSEEYGHVSDIPDMQRAQVGSDQPEESLEVDDTESIETSYALEAEDLHHATSTEKTEPAQPVRVSLSSPSDRSLGGGLANPDHREMGESISSGSGVSQGGSEGDGVMQESSATETSPADLVTQAAASVQQSAETRDQEDEWHEDSFSSDEMSSVYEDRYALDDQDPVADVSEASRLDDTLDQPDDDSDHSASAESLRSMHE